VATTPPRLQSLVWTLLEAYCARHNLKLTRLDDYGHSGLVENPAGQRRFFLGTHFDLNPLGASEIADDKAASLKLFQSDGLIIPEGVVLSGKNASNSAIQFSERVGFPVFLKPNTGQEGQDVERLETPEQLKSACTRLLEHHRLLLLQEAISGEDLRVLVLEGEVLGVIKRSPPTVTGDGVRSLKTMIEQLDAGLLADPRCAACLASQNLSLDCVPEKGQVIALLSNANLSSGGKGHLLDGPTPLTIKDAAIRAANSLGLRYAGVDMIVKADGQPILLEINAAPGLARFAAQGPSDRAVAAQFYERVFDAFTVSFRQ